VVPIEGWIDPYWIDLHEASLLLEAVELEAVAAILERYGDSVADRADPWTPPGCGPSGWA
jgi:hypothetical protein